MDAVRLAKVLALAHVAIALLGFYHFQSFESRPLTWQTLAFGAFYPLPPLLAAWGGARLAGGLKSRQLLAFGLIVAVALALVAYLVVMSAGKDEPLAPLLLFIASLWQAAGLFVLMPIVWLVARYEPCPSAANQQS